MHTGPDQGTKLHDALEKLTTCGVATLCAGVEEWLVWRLHESVDVARFLDHADSLIAWECDRRYRDEGPLTGTIPADTPVNQALGDGVWLIRRATDDEFWDYPAAAANKAAAAISVVKQTMPDKPKKSFLTWLDWALARAAKLDPRPRKARPKRKDFADDESYRAALRPIFGNPLPREALNPDADYAPDARERYLASFLESLDWKKNPFLRSPAEMKKLGFKGTPYEL
jgi:hypothetical protein